MMRARFASVSLLACCTAVHAAEPLVSFSDAAGCKLQTSADGARRLREIASQGRVLWEGACRGGWIDGPGVLRHEGLADENGRKRRYAFFLTGVAQSGLREGNWMRESFNMFTDSSRYWTSLATLKYGGGVARGGAVQREVRSNNEFSAMFRRYLAEVDRELAQRPTTPTADSRDALPPPPAPPEPAIAADPSPPAQAAATPAPAAAAATPAPAAPPIAATPMVAAPAASVPAAVAPAAKPPATASPPVSAAAPVAAPSATPERNRPAPAPPAAAREPPAAPVAQARSGAPLPAPPVSRDEPRPVVSASASRFSGSLAPPSGTGLRPSAGLGLKPREPLSGPPGPQLLEQLQGCSMDMINGVVIGREPSTATRGQPVRVTGWAVDPRERNIPARAWIRLAAITRDGGVTADVVRNVERPDVAQVLGDEAYRQSGFDIQVGTADLPAGDYIVGIVQQAGDAMLICQSMARLTLR